MSRKNKIFISAAILLLGLIVTGSATALDVGTNEINSTIQLGAGDPRVIISRIINFSMIFLGVIAVGIVLFAGFKWMTSEGNEEQIADAKKILKGGLIGLAIVLSSWGIASFVINRLLDANTNTTPGSSCNTGDSTSCGCGGTKICVAGAWGACVGSDCSNPGNGSNSCDATPLTPSTCDPDNTVCGSGYFCDNTSCICQSAGGLGASCNASANPSVCQADNNRCGQYLECRPSDCTCFGPPVIADISPVGGFCQNNVNKACSKDSDCTNSTCNLNQPNGQPNNLISIHGFNFGTGSSTPSTTPRVVFMGNASVATDDKDGVNPNVVNADCTNTWSDHEIIIAIPAGVVAGPIKVVAANGEDSTDNTIGPIIPDFVPNTMQRPGICRLTPDKGKMSDAISYYGSNLKGEAYFGNYESKYKAISSTYNPAGTYNQAVVSNISTGKTTTFVMDSANYQPSNYVNFTKEQEPDLGPSISSFEPASGPAGQYVTIYGSGFGNKRNGKVLFSRAAGDIEAAYDFPDVCLHSVWSDNQVIIKVPAGIASSTYSIKMQIGSWTISTASSSKFFSANTAPLSPALCKIEPLRGNNDSPVTVWGEYFGTTGSSGQVQFYNNKVASGVITADGTASKISTKVPLTAVTGPVRVVQASRSSNGLNFTVGACSTNADCGVQFCCPAGTPNEGRCVAALMDDTNGCYTKVKNSVFEWTFGTGFSGAQNCDSDTDCPPGQICDPATNTCQNPVYSCAYKGTAMNACPTGNCPNSSGQCSPYSGLGKFVANGPACDDNACKSFAPCAAGGCIYNLTYNACTKSTPETCDLDIEVNFGGVIGTTTKFCNAQKNWEAEIASTCPTGWTKNANGNCIQSGVACSICSQDFTCTPNTAAPGKGICTTANICPAGSTCSTNASIPATYKKCVTPESDKCECCCQIGQDARDCCAPLKCTGTCGNDVTDDAAGFGHCTGCYGSGTTTSARDAACNCSNSQGKYCQADGGSGYCTDCTSLKTATDCAAHAQVCCWDDRLGVCHGGNGTIISNVATNPAYGHCAYYGCNITNVSQCAATTPVVGTTTTVIKGTLTAPLGIYTSTSTCVAGCAKTTLCDYIGNFTSCTSYNGCCWDGGSATPKCTYGDKLNSSNTSVVADWGYCAYYHCTNSGSLPLQCASTSPVKTGTYSGLATFKDLSSCDRGCGASVYGLGQDCSQTTLTNWRTSNATSTTGTTVCQPSICGAPFACLNAAGSANTTTADCGVCCCTPNLPADQDACKKIGADSANLNCVAGKGSCSGGSRGLCCGCKTDNECDNGQGLMGCGQLDGCCHNRPDIDVANIFPKQGQNNVCRNLSIEVPFTAGMNPESFTDNFLLLEEHNYSDGVCPEGTFVAVKTNIFERIIARIHDLVARPLRYIARLFHVSEPALASLPDSTKLYCSVTGTVSGEQLPNGKTVLSFAPSRMLKADTNYFMVVKGEKDLAGGHLGVLDLEGIGMNGRGFLSGATYVEGEDASMAFNNVNYPNSYIFTFRTMSEQGQSKGACTIDHAIITPASYLFNKNKNELSANENDLNYISPNFDTANDSDKLYIAKAISADNQILSPLPGYQWKWLWDNDSQVTTLVSGITNLPNAYDDRKLVRVVDGVTDKTTFIKATVSMSSYASTNFISTGDNAFVQAPVYVFVCNNPWPPVNQATGLWSPWSDTCPSGYPGCEIFNYELYYCRDAAGDSITADDLPAILSDLNAQTGNLGTYQTKICSNQRKNCSVDADCPGGYCVSAVLKESYFFREDLPSFGKILSVTPDAAGGSVSISFEAMQPVKAFKIYYNLSSLPNNVTPTDIPTSKCSLAGGKYTCNANISGLSNGKEYNFKFTVVNTKDVESQFSNIISATPKDTSAPAVPSGFKTESFNSGTNQVTFAWSKNTDDAVGYKIYNGIGVGSDSFGAAYDIKGVESTRAIFNLGNMADGYHYFAISAVDGSGNESDTSATVKTYCLQGSCFAAPCKANTDCSSCQSCNSEICMPSAKGVTDSRCKVSETNSGKVYYTCLNQICDGSGRCGYDKSATKKPCFSGDDSTCDSTGACCSYGACSVYQQ